MIILVIRVILFTINTISNLITLLIFNLTSSLLILLLQGLRAPGLAVQSGLNHFGQVLGSAAHYAFRLIWEAATSTASAVVEAIFDAVFRSISATGSAVGGMVGAARESMEGVVKEFLSEVGKEVSDLVVKVVSDAWDNYKDAVAFVAENVVAD